MSWQSIQAKKNFEEALESGNLAKLAAMNQRLKDLATGDAKLAVVERKLRECRCGGLGCLPRHRMMLEALRHEHRLHPACNHVVRVPVEVAQEFDLLPQAVAIATKGELVAHWYGRASKEYVRVPGPYSNVISYPWYDPSGTPPIAAWIRWCLAHVMQHRVPWERPADFDPSK